MKKLILVLGVSAFCLPATAGAHFTLVSPPPTSADTSGGKGAPPCGPNVTSGVATAAQGGHPLTVMINETVQHTGFYRFALALNSPSELPPDNTVYSGPNMTGTILTVNSTMNSGSAGFEATPVFPVIADHMFPHTAFGSPAASGVTTVPAAGTVTFPSATFPGTVMLPNVTCASCTLQVIEFMEDHGSNAGGGYFYHHCANLKITADPNLPLFTPGAGGASSGGAGGGVSTSGGAGGTSTSGGSGGTVVGSGGAASSSGGSGGVAPTGSGGQTSSGAGVAGTPVVAAGGDAAGPAAADNAGCSCSLSKRSGGSAPWASLLVGLLAFCRRRAKR
jgi:hypothetical protein